MATGKITKRLVDALIADAKRAGRTLIVWDADLTRFGVRATKAGATAYIVQYRIGGRAAASKRLTIGKHGALTPDEARKLASTKLGEVDRGRDVAQEKKDARRKLTAGTLTEAAKRFLALNGKGRRYWPDVKRLIEFDVLPVLGKKPVTTITRADLAALIDNIAMRSPAVARLVFSAIRPMFRWFVERGLLEHNPLTGLRAPEASKARERVLTDEEIQTFWRACDQMEWPFGPVFQLLLLTGARRNEVASMAWEEINLSKGQWILPGERTKNHKEHAINLPTQARAILEALPGERNGLLFSTTGRTAVSGFSKAKRRLDGLMLEIMRGERADAELQEWHTHDLRRTFVTLMNERLRIAPHIVEACVNHISGGAKAGVAGVYNRARYSDESKAAMLVWGAFVERLVCGDMPGNIVAFSEYK